MIILIHVCIALSSILWTTLLFLSPSRRKFLVNYALIGATFASGTYLVIATHSRLLPACIAGITYLTAVTVGTVLAHVRLERVRLRVTDRYDQHEL